MREELVTCISDPRVDRVRTHMQVGGDFAVSTAEQRRQLQALKALDTCLAALTAAAPGNESAITFVL